MGRLDASFLSRARVSHARSTALPRRRFFSSLDLRQDRASRRKRFLPGRPRLRRIGLACPVRRAQPAVSREPEPRPRVSRIASSEAADSPAAVDRDLQEADGTSEWPLGISFRTRAGAACHDARFRTQPGIAEARRRSHTPRAAIFRGFRPLDGRSVGATRSPLDPRSRAERQSRVAAGRQGLASLAPRRQASCHYGRASHLMAASSRCSGGPPNPERLPLAPAAV